MCRQPSANFHGFTLIEFIFSTAILATLCAVSLPALGSLTQSSRSRAANNSLITALNLARSSAVSRGSEFVLCPSADQNHCDDGIWWQQGWIVFQDLDRNGTRNGDEPILNVIQAQPGMAIASSIGRDHVTYRIDGSATGTNLTFTVCDHRGSTHASTIVVSNSGRPRQGISTLAHRARGWLHGTGGRAGRGAWRATGLPRPAGAARGDRRPRRGTATKAQAAAACAGL